MMRTLGRTSGSSACERMPVSRFPVCTANIARVAPRVAVRVTVTEPPTEADTTPSTGVMFSSPEPSGFTDQTLCTQGTSASFATNVTRVPVPSTDRTCRPAGVTAVPSTITRLAPSRSAQVTR